MHSDQKKQLTQAEQSENNVFEKLKELARKTEYGTLKCVIKIHQGHIVEVAPEILIPAIRG